MAGWPSGRLVDNGPKEHLLVTQDERLIAMTLDEEDRADCVKTWRGQTSPTTEHIHYIDTTVYSWR